MTNGGEKLRPTVLFAGVAVSASTFKECVDWYGSLFGRPPDLVVHENEVMWQATDGGWVYVVVDPERHGHGLVTLAVDDLDETLEQLAVRDITTGYIVMPGAGRKAPVEDPDGNLVSLIEVENHSD